MVHTSTPIHPKTPHSQGGADSEKPLVLVYLPDNPQQALIALGLIGAWKERLPDISFDVLCTPHIKTLARHCASLRLVISFIDSDQPLKRDVQQGNQLSTFGYKCTMALTTSWHPQLTLRFTKTTWRLGWKTGLLSRLLLSSSCQPDDWRCLWKQFSPNLPFPSEQPVAKLVSDTSETHNAMLQLGLSKHHALLVITDHPLHPSWKKALEEVRQQGVRLLSCGALGNNTQGWFDAAAASPFENTVLDAMPSMRLVLGNNKIHADLAAAFGIGYRDMNHPPKPDWSS